MARIRVRVRLPEPCSMCGKRPSVEIGLCAACLALRCPKPDEPTKTILGRPGALDPVVQEQKRRLAALRATTAGHRRDQDDGDGIESREPEDATPPSEGRIDLLLLLVSRPRTRVK